MKLLSSLLCILIIICYSCNGSDEQVPVSSPGETEQLLQLKQQITNYPDSLLLVEKLIEYYRENGIYDSALAVTDKAIKTAPDIHGLWNIKGTLHFENGDTIPAMKAFEQAVNIYPLPQYIMSLGTVYAQTKNAKALTMADALTFADKAKAGKQAFFIKGLYYSYTGDKKKAIALFDSCIQQDYNYMIAYREKGIALYDQAKYEEALKVLDKAVTIQNNFDEGYYWMGNCYKKLNRKEEAIESYRRALMYDKNFIEARDSLKTLE